MQSSGSNCHPNPREFDGLPITSGILHPISRPHQPQPQPIIHHPYPYPRPCFGNNNPNPYGTFKKY